MTFGAATSSLLVLFFLWGRSHVRHHHHRQQHPDVAASVHVAERRLSFASTSTEGADRSSASYCRGGPSTNHKGDETNNQCFPLKPMASSTTSTSISPVYYGQVCLELVNGNGQNTMLEVSFSTDEDEVDSLENHTSNNQWEIQHASFWLGSDLQQVPTLPEASASLKDESKYILDVDRFPYASTLEKYANPKLQTTRQWNQIIDLKQEEDYICPSPQVSSSSSSSSGGSWWSSRPKKEDTNSTNAATASRYFIAQVILVQWTTPKDGTGEATMDESTRIVTYAASNSRVADSKNDGTSASSSLDSAYFIECSCNPPSSAAEEEEEEKPVESDNDNEDQQDGEEDFDEEATEFEVEVNNMLKATHNQKQQQLQKQQATQPQQDKEKAVETKAGKEKAEETKVENEKAGDETAIAKNQTVATPAHKNATIKVQAANATNKETHKVVEPEAEAAKEEDKVSTNDTHNDSKVTSKEQPATIQAANATKKETLVEQEPAAAKEEDKVSSNDTHNDSKAASKEQPATLPESSELKQNKTMIQVEEEEMEEAMDMNELPPKNGLHDEDAILVEDEESSSLPQPSITLAGGLVQADELELTTSFFIVMSKQLTFLLLWEDEESLHETEKQIEASPELHDAWHRFVAQLMTDHGIPSVNTTTSMKEEAAAAAPPQILETTYNHSLSGSKHKNERRSQDGKVGDGRNLRGKGGKDEMTAEAVAIEWIEDSPNLFQFLIQTQCPPNVLDGSHGVEFGSSPKELVRGSSSRNNDKDEDRDSSSSQATCYKAFGSFRVLHFRERGMTTRLADDQANSGGGNASATVASATVENSFGGTTSSQQKVCSAIFDMTRQALAKDQLSDYLPPELPFMIHAGKPESCVPTGESIMVAKPHDMKTLANYRTMDSSSSKHRSYSALYDLHYKDGSLNILRVMELVVYLLASLLLMALCLSIYCWFLPKIDLEARNRVTDDWSEPSSSTSKEPSSRGPEFYPWLD